MQMQRYEYGIIGDLLISPITYGRYDMVSVAKGFLTLHGDSYFSIKLLEAPHGLFSAYTLLGRESLERFKNPDNS